MQEVMRMCGKATASLIWLLIVYIGFDKTWLSSTIRDAYIFDALCLTYRAVSFIFKVFSEPTGLTKLSII